MSYKNEEYAQQAALEAAKDSGICSSCHEHRSNHASWCIFRTSAKAAPVDGSEHLSADQKLMREEMEAGVHKPARAGKVVADMMGIGDDREVTMMALNMIETHAPYLQLSFSQWAAVQRTVEAGILAGILAGRNRVKQGG